MRAYDRSKKIERMVIHDHPCLYGVRGLCSHPRCLEAHFEFLDTSATLDDAFDAFTVMLNEVAEDRAYSIAHEDGGPNCPDFEGVVERSTVMETLKLLQSYRARLDAEIHQHSGGCYTKTLEARIAELERDRDAYSELIMAVGTKFPGESRHQTALRYIQQQESGGGSRTISESR